MEQVAERAGPGTAANPRQRFPAALGTSPSAYRATLRGGRARGRDGGLAGHV
ncbi:hypothetical protein GCM10010360_57110 [Streptomyces nogalater]